MAAGSVPLSPVPALCDLSALALCRMVPGGRLASPAAAAQRGKFIFSAPTLHPPFQSGAFLEPKGRKGHGLASLPHSVLSLRSSRRLPMALSGSACSVCPCAFFLVLPKYPGLAASVSEQRGKNALVESCRAPSCPQKGGVGHT